MVFGLQIYSPVLSVRLFYFQGFYNIAGTFLLVPVSQEFSLTLRFLTVYFSLRVIHNVFSLVCF